MHVYYMLHTHFESLVGISEEAMDVIDCKTCRRSRALTMKMDTLQSLIVELFSVAAFGFQILYFYMKYKRSLEW